MREKTVAEARTIAQHRRDDAVVVETGTEGKILEVLQQFKWVPKMQNFGKSAKQKNILWSRELLQHEFI